ncbi:MAG: preprotein translocase subunit SecY [Planctomycetota bacterium]|nr:preprotein translocase subunit SecY [Planctomycetota bacterium]
MWEKIRIIFTIPELRQKILLTLLFLAIYRIGWQIPLPIVDRDQMTAHFSQTGGLGDVLQQVAVFSASQLNQATIFGLGIMPYISASIIFQLLGSVYKPLEELQKEGEAGRKKINEYTRYATVALCLLQSYMYLRYLISVSAAQPLRPLINESIWVLMDPNSESYSMFASVAWQLAAVLTMTAGTVFLMWLGEQIDEFGIGNGISLLIMAGILAGMPGAAFQLWERTTPQLGGSGNDLGIEHLIVLAAMFVAVVFGVVYITQGQRRIPTQSAKHVRGRRVFGGARQYLPLRVNQAGVMPIIFASSLLMVPMILFNQLSQVYPTTIMSDLANIFQRGTSFTYNLLYVGLIYFFCYFWTAITFNPKDMAENLKNFGTFIPGYRPGKRTADYLEKVMVRITYVGAGFLALVAIIPTVISGAMNVPFLVASFYGGTGLLIAVSVAFDLVQKIDSHLVMRNYKGLLERT